MNIDNRMFEKCEFETLKGHTLEYHISSYEYIEGLRLEIKSKNGYAFRFIHHQECCEDVYLEDGLDDLLDIIQSDEEILLAEKSTNRDDNYKDHDLEFPTDYHDELTTYTFYKLRTRSYSCTLRFFGCSNGYYSEEVDFEVCKTED